MIWLLVRRCQWITYNTAQPSLSTKSAQLIPYVLFSFDMNECVFVKSCRLLTAHYCSIGCDVYRFRFYRCCCCCSASDLFSFTRSYVIWLPFNIVFCTYTQQHPAPVSTTLRARSRQRERERENVFGCLCVRAQRSQILCCYYGSSLGFVFHSQRCYVVSVTICVLNTVYKYINRTTHWGTVMI